MSEITSSIPLQINPDLQEERDKASFNVTELTHIIYGGIEKTKKRKRLEKLLFSDPFFQEYQNVRAFGSRSEYYAASVKKSTKIFKLRRQHKWTDEEYETVLDICHDDLALTLHHTMFIPALERLATEDQKSKWLTLAKQYKIIGTYAQTELGHGTYLQGLETTATYDPQTREFVMNTPTLSAMKWWPGSLGKSSNHALVLATLIISGKKYGMHPFLVQLRSMDDHKVLPGVRVGDIGAKMGGNSVDNGYLILDNVRIPRNNMLMKNAQVSPDGKFVTRGPSKANYATMMLIRVQICTMAYQVVSSGATIGIRYSAVRRQSKLDPQDREPKILEYQTQQYKIFPGLAMSYAFLFASRSLTRKYEEAFAEIQRGDFKSLPELHCLSSGLKSFCSEHSVRQVEIIRQSCGGHGYLNAAGLGMLVNAAAPMITVEGENTVMYLQLARYILKRFAGAMSGQQLDGSTSYLSMDPATYVCPVMSETDCRNLTALCDIYRYRSYMTVCRVARQVQHDMESDMPQHVAINKNLVDLVRAAKAHSYYIVVKDFVEGVDALVASAPVIKVLRTLCCFYAAHGIAEYSGDFLESEAVGLHQLKWIKNLQVSLLGEIRPDAVALVDAFDYHDITLSSALGCYDGNAYERLFKSTENDPMNKEEVHPSYYQYLKPFMEEMNKSKL
ncbi:hypothetical protein FSP39_001824 [Pinctada imbricata]|uniref:Acyl-coenzyme A oxidase n=1 Tax=Pinctada imbricata TaxID=66713 RepID=A0AA88XQ23_PINIB|nr:hypothetical protein FSP39_001824 [Pinctada imbricata]